MSSPRPYAEKSSVSVEKSHAELDAILAKHGASQRGIMTDDEHAQAIVAFQIRGRAYRLELPLPKRDDVEKATRNTIGWWRLTTVQQQARVAASFDQAARTRWRALVLLVKSKLELVRIGATTVEREFLADMVLPGGATVGRLIEDQMHAIRSGEMPKLLGSASEVQP